MILISDPPIVAIRLGKNLVADDIRQGNDVYFDCLIEANPPPTTKTVTWLHNVSSLLKIGLQDTFSKRILSNNLRNLLKLNQKI